MNTYEFRQWSTFEEWYKVEANDEKEAWNKVYKLGRDDIITPKWVGSEGLELYRTTHGEAENCYWCGQDGKEVEAMKSLRAPVEADLDDEGKEVPIYAMIGLCENHLNDYAEGMGVYKSYH